MAIWRSALLIAFILHGSIATAAGLVLKSGPQRAVMIELYTSEGCNSCPPADQFLNQLANNKQLWKTYIPMAFHVDYWDRLGWRDRFASPTYSQRQRQYARRYATSTIYTPEFFVDGREWRRWFRKPLPDPVTDSVGTLTVRLDKNRLEAQFFPIRREDTRLVLHIARLGMQLNSRVGAGENAGRILHHDFVVLQYIQLGSSHLRWSTTLPSLTISATRQALVAWVSRPADPRPLQAVGGYITPYATVNYQPK